MLQFIEGDAANTSRSTTTGDGGGGPTGLHRAHSDDRGGRSGPMGLSLSQETDGNLNKEGKALSVALASAFFVPTSTIRLALSTSIAWLFPL
jgi:hypothetical protein